MKALSRGRAFLLRWGCAGLFIRCKIVVSRQLLEKAEASFRGMIAGGAKRQMMGR